MFINNGPELNKIYAWVVNLNARPELNKIHAQVVNFAGS